MDDSDVALPKYVTSFRQYWNLSASQHRHFVEEKSDLLTSLEELESENLSLKLYDVYRLKHRPLPSAREEAASDNSEDDGQANQQDNALQWKQSRRWKGPRTPRQRRNWTAWPLDSHLVPRPQNQSSWAGEIGIDRAEARKQGDSLEPISSFPSKPSDLMEELLLAEILRSATALYAKRGGNDPDTRKAQQSQDYEAMDIGDVESNNDEHKHKDYGNDPTKLAEDDIGLRLVPIADDEQAGLILKPIIRHILQQIESLLRALHCSRQNHVERLRYPPNSHNLEDSGHSTSAPNLGAGLDDSNTRARKRKKISRQGQKAGLRDWKEVLGIASNVGWNPEVVSRATSRCSELFGENFHFHTLEEYENKTQGPEKRNGKTRKVRGTSPGGRAMYGGVHNDGFLEPIATQKGWAQSWFSAKVQNTKQTQNQDPDGATAISDNEDGGE